MRRVRPREARDGALVRLPVRLLRPLARALVQLPDLDPARRSARGRSCWRAAPVVERARRQAQAVVVVGRVRDEVAMCIWQH